MASSGQPTKPTFVDLPKAAPRRAPNAGPSPADLERFLGGRSRPDLPPKRDRSDTWIK